MIIITILLYPFNFCYDQLKNLSWLIWLKFRNDFGPMLIQYFADYKLLVSFYYTLIREIKFIDAVATLFKMFYYIAATLEAIFGLAVKLVRLIKIAIWPISVYLAKTAYWIMVYCFHFLKSIFSKIFANIKYQMRKNQKIDSIVVVQRKKRVPHSYESIIILEEWFEQNIRCPYPSIKTKYELSESTKLSLTQINNWFINRRRSWKRND